MEYTATQLSTIIEFLDTIGSASFMSGFKDGLYDIRCELNGEEYTPVPDTSLMSRSCYAAGFEAAERCVEAWLSDRADSREKLVGMRRLLDRFDAFCSFDFQQLFIITT